MTEVSLAIGETVRLQVLNQLCASHYAGRQ
jgi:hypothetical protein